MAHAAIAAIVKAMPDEELRGIVKPGSHHRGEAAAKAYEAWKNAVIVRAKAYVERGQMSDRLMRLLNRNILQYTLELDKTEFLANQNAPFLDHI